MPRIELPLSQKLSKRQQRKLNYLQVRVRGENRGWAKTRSGYVKVWQLVPGGRYTEFVGRG